ncbi:hypothetical protein [Corynebacterium timonense]|uniref:Alpha helical Porin B n=1 Tax=Corynebacterium timonense TaxID=441500 RepID=A0A1H1M680_9CORY|nr:hypothetical protein [Corynebacterium timonense]SDR81905.1 Alpha helical Porin B [Corynebacterium timonense]
MRRIAPALTAGLIAAAALAAPAQAQTQPNYLELLKIVNGNVATADCGLVGTALRATGFVTDQTTRSGLVTSLNKAIGDDAALRLVASGTISAVGDRALECGVVKPDPETPVDQALKLSSQLSSQAGLPQIRDLVPTLR